MITDYSDLLIRKKNEPAEGYEVMQDAGLRPRFWSMQL